MPVAVYRFGRFVLDPASFRLRRDGTDVPLTPKAFEVLALLVRERRRGLTKQELFDAVWPDTAVTENTLTQRIKELRQALGDSPQEPTYIRTIPRVGYQFVGEVTEEVAPAEQPTPEPAKEPFEPTVRAVGHDVVAFDRSRQGRDIPGAACRKAGRRCVEVFDDASRRPLASIHRSVAASVSPS